MFFCSNNVLPAEARTVVDYHDAIYRMTDQPNLAVLGTGLLLLVHVAVLLRVILRPHREPASRVAWVVVIIAVPVLGLIAYLMLGETNVGRRQVARDRKVFSEMPTVDEILRMEAPEFRPVIPGIYAHLFQLGQSVNGYPAVGGNQAHLMTDSNAAIESMIADINAAKAHVHLTFYIWLTDNNGLKMVEALKRAAARGVVCRAMADGLGSRAMIESIHWKEMRDSGVRVATALPIGDPLLRPLRGRIDLRNHRKILVIDNSITYCGSQNCADPEFRVKAKFAPWVDVMMRFTGPVVRQNQHLFASDWLGQVDDNLDGVLTEPVLTSEVGFAAQVIGTGPTVRNSAMPEIFENLIYTARREIFITTPYYVPDDPMQTALCSCALRGVKTTLILPARNDSWIVGAASRSYYADLLAAGVGIHEYDGGLLHTKSLTLDDEITLIGSANMDRRSFELNYENNILLCSRSVTAEMRLRQDEYLAHSHPITREMVASWPLYRRFWNNSIAMLGPVL